MVASGGEVVYHGGEAGASVAQGAHKVDLSGIPTAHVVRAAPNPAKLIKTDLARVRDALGELSPGCRIIGLSKGQFDFLDMIRWSLEQTGPAALLLATWTCGVKQAHSLAGLVASGAISEFAMLVDRSLPTRKPEMWNAIRTMFAPRHILRSRTHCKFCVITNEEWSITIRTSMNMTGNPRIESFDLDDDPAIAEHFGSLFRDIAALNPGGAAEPAAKCSRTLDLLWAVDKGSVTNHGALGIDWTVGPEW